VEPQDPDLLLFLGRAYNAAERTGEARHVLEQALAVAPEYPDLHLMLGVRDFADGDLATARSRFERFLALAPARQEEVAAWLERTRQVSR
jgi:cytochrome c-type biogenesis protein CcmH/NrfG